MRTNLVNISALSARRFDEGVVVGESGDMKRGPAANAVFDAKQSLSAVLCQFHHSICNPFLVCKVSIEGVLLKQNLASCKAHCTPRSQSVQGCGPDDDDQRCKYSLTKPIIRTKKKAGRITRTCLTPCCLSHSLSPWPAAAQPRRGQILRLRLNAAASSHAHPAR
jgi:hypothetical protein